MESFDGKNPKYAKINGAATSAPGKTVPKAMQSFLPKPNFLMKNIVMGTASTIPGSLATEAQNMSSLDNSNT